MKRKVLLTAAATALAATISFQAGAAEPIKPGETISIDATVCLTERAAQLIADTARKAGTGYDAYITLKAAGQCGDAMTTGTIEKVITEFDDTKIGHTRLVQIRIDGKAGKDGLLYGLVGDAIETPLPCQGICI